ncbi:MAG TPA: MBL fold metallo-hydrolase [Pseudoneobacillus sp.]|nr:MBL fold metallo-hydrolase [Pseudoneobacillus sp.]
MRLSVIGFWGGYPKRNEASSGYILEHDGFNLLIDCGSGVLSKLQNYLQPEEIDAVILSHYHPDHIADIGVLQHARLIQGFLGKDFGTLPIYGHDHDQQEFMKLTYKEITKGVAYNPSLPLKVGPFEISFVQTNHPAVCYAMRIEVEGKILIYTGDTSFKEELISFSKDADLLLCECNFYGNQNGKSAGHMTSIDAGTLAHDSNAKKLVLTHLPHYGNLAQLVEEAKSKYGREVHLAKEGLIFEI